eukprot:2974265-Alexandrium_andersonii.AAC.1
MSASLVGSEMCIRDSAGAPRSYPAVRAGVGARNRAARAPRKLRGQTLRPVSYTHLTLPTICSV